MSAWLIGMSAAATTALLLVLVFYVGGGDARATMEKTDATPTATEGTQDAAAVQPDEKPSEKMLDAERKASKAFARLEARLNQVPQSNTVLRNQLCQEFLREHGNSIVASRVRVLMAGK